MPERRRLGLQGYGQSGSEQGGADGQGAPQVPQLDPGRAVAVYLSPDDQYLAVGTAANRLAVYRLLGESLGERLGEWEADLDLKVAWSESGRSLAFASTGGDIRVLHLPGLETSMLPGPTTAVAFYPDAARLAVAYESSLSVYEFSSQPYTRATQLPPGRENENLHDIRFLLAVSPDARWVACSTETCTIQILDTAHHGLIHEFAAHQDIVTDLEWLGPGHLVTASADKTIRIWQVDRGRELRVLEIDKPVLGVTYAPDLHCVVGWTRNTYLFWSVATGEIMRHGRLPSEAVFGGRQIAASKNSTLLVMLSGPAVTDIKFSRGWDTGPGSQPGSVSSYANAKILLLGDSGVGKSGMALVLAGEQFRPTESTHGRRIWRMPAAEVDAAADAQREILLWDLAGQPGYRVVHQLHLSDAAAALVLFDARSETEPLAGVGYWARALRHAQASTRSSIAIPTFLVAARTDRGIHSISDERIAHEVEKFGFRGYLATSAREGWGIAELRMAVLDAIDWSRIPVVTSSALFAAAKSFVLEQKAAGSLLVPLAALLAAFVTAPVTGPAAEVSPGARVGRDLLDAETDPDDDDGTRLRRVFEGCVARLEAAGLVKRLAFGDFVLLQPELIDVYAGAIVNAARDEPDGLGSILQDDVLALNFRFPRKERIADARQEKLLLITTLEELIRHEIVLQEESEEGALLVFPTELRKDRHGLVQPADITVEFTFEGPVVNIYATLIVRLARSGRFTRRGAWQSAAQFEPDSGGTCTVHLVLSDEGQGAFQVGYSRDVPESVRLQFDRFVMAHLERRAIPGTVQRKRSYRCPNCGLALTAAALEEARKRKQTILYCSLDLTRVRLEDPYAFGVAQDEVTRQMDDTADAARTRAIAEPVILGKQETTDFDVFFCYNAADKQDVRLVAQWLRARGILPWFDETELPPGSDWLDELSRQITTVHTAAVFVGPNGISQWQDREVKALLNEFTERRCTVIPVLLPGATGLPVLLKSMSWVDLRNQDEEEFTRLIWGINRGKPT